MDKIWDPLRRKEVALTPEEKVRQWFISILHEQAGVPLHLMSSEVSMRIGQKMLRADIVVFRRDLTPVLLVECKRPDVKLSEAVLQQVLRYHAQMDASYLVVTNGTQTRLFRRASGQFHPGDHLPTYEQMQ